MKRSIPSLLVVVFGLSWSLCAAQRHLEVTGDNVNIRTDASTRSQTVGKANKGDVFRFLGEKGSWYQIELFSGESRFIHNSLARPVSYEPEAPEDSAVRQRIFEILNRATERAKMEAAERYPPGKDLKKNLDYASFLNDKYKLELIHELQVQAPIYRRIVIEGNQKGW